MGRPPGSKNKTKEETKKPVPLKQLEIEAAKRVEKSAVDLSAYIKATTELAMIAGREYIVQKLLGWLDDKKKLYPGQQLKLVVTEKKDQHEYALVLDGAKVDSRHIFQAEVEDVVRGVLGCR